MAANKQQGSYLTLFWTGATALCAGLAYLAEGFGKQRRSKAEFKRYLLMAIGSAAIRRAAFSSPSRRTRAQSP